MQAGAVARRPSDSTMVELRKRPASATPSAPPSKKHASAGSETKKGVVAQVKKTAEKVFGGAKKSKHAKQGDTVDLEGFGGEVETEAGVKVSLAKLIKDSKSGVVLFTYPKASTPGCEYSG